MNGERDITFGEDNMGNITLIIINLGFLLSFIPSPLSPTVEGK